MAPRSGIPSDYDISNLLEDISTANGNHIGNWMLPVSTAYNTAFNEVNRVLEEQASANRARAELIGNLLMIAVTVPIGGWMTARLGKATLAQGLGDAAIRTMSRSNHIAVIGTGVWFLENDAARYMLQGAYSQVTRYVTRATLAGLTSGLTANPFAGFTNHRLSELQFRNKLEEWVYAHNNFLRGAATRIRDNSSISTSEKDAMARELSGVKFIADQPTTSRISNRRTAAETIETALWMGIMLDMDYLMTSFEDWRGNYAVTGWRNAGGISATPGSAQYPTERGPARGSHSGGVRIGHRAPGSIVLDHVERLYGTYVGGTFLQGTGFMGSRNLEYSDGFNGDEMIRAERALRILARRYRLN